MIREPPLKARQFCQDTMFNITLERPEDTVEVERLLDLAFGPDRFAKTAYRLREGIAPVAELCFVVREDGVMRGSLRFWPIVIQGMPALLLGPLAVDPRHRGRGAGISLMEHAIAEARRMGWRIIVLVGDEPYYARVGFSREKARRLQLPGPVDEARFLALELVPDALDGVAGMIERADGQAVNPSALASLAMPREEQQS